MQDHHEHNFEFSSDEWNTCLKVLMALKDHPEHNPDNQRFSGLISKIYKNHKKQSRKESYADKQQENQKLRKETISAIQALNNLSTYSSSQTDQVICSYKNFSTPQTCYVCNEKYLAIHSFYHRLCPNCAEYNYKMRFECVDLSNRNVIITGGRVKVGYATALKFLKSGANVCITTRFPAQALQQFMQETDYEIWANRLYVYGLDLRSLYHLEQFLEFYRDKYKTLDILINNAAQTIHYPETYYAPLIQREQQAIQSGLQKQSLNWTANTTSLASGLAQIPDQFFPVDTDVNRFGQPVDYREKNSWNSTLSDIGLQELLEVNLINHIAPYRLIQGLKSCMDQSSHTEKFIINITSSEGIFSYQNKTKYHPHTNMTKAALNMLTRTSAQDLINDQIYMCAVDVGWISTGVSEKIRLKQFDKAVIPPLDSVDGASRVMHPIIEGIRGHYFIGVLLKDYAIHSW